MAHWSPNFPVVTDRRDAGMPGGMPIIRHQLFQQCAAGIGGVAPKLGFLPLKTLYLGKAPNILKWKAALTFTQPGFDIAYHVCYCNLQLVGTKP